MAGSRNSVTHHSPRQGEVHIRLFSLAVSAAELDRLEVLLSQNELERADRLIDSQIRNRFVAGRGLLRKTLAKYLNHSPATLSLAANQYGKPFLSDEHLHHGISFNLSHSGELAIMAIGRHCQLGIDLEQLRDDLPFRDMARQFFSLREQSELFSLPTELQPAAFFRCWTRKEAYLKGCGSGFSKPSNLCDVSLLLDQPPALREDLNKSAPSEWILTDLNVPAGFCASLAILGQSRFTVISNTL